MRKRPLLLITAALTATFVFGFEAHRRDLFPKLASRVAKRWHSPTERPAPKGRWGSAPKAKAGSAVDTPDLGALGYAPGTRLAGSESWVTVHDRSAAYAGFNVFTSGHAPEALLTDMDGRVLHRWSITFEAAWPGRELKGRADCWRRGHLFENGDFIAMFDNLGLVKLDKASRPLWAKAMNCHHDFEVLPDGRICVLTHELAPHPDLGKGKPIWNDAVALLGADGNVLESVPILDALESSSYAPILARLPDINDVLHTNTVEVFDGTRERFSPLFRAGNVLISLRSIDTIAILDMRTRRVEWALSGLWSKQHDPTLLDNGHLLVFDNQGLGGESRVLEVDPFTQSVVWSYRGSEEHPFYSQFCGVNRPLPNGNVLVIESEGGRAFEVTRDGRIVWEFYNPFLTGEQSELIALIFDMVRLPPDFQIDWINR